MHPRPLERNLLEEHGRQERDAMYKVHGRPASHARRYLRHTTLYLTLRLRAELLCGWGRFRVTECACCETKDKMMMQIAAGGNVLGGVKHFRTRT